MTGVRPGPVCTIRDGIDFIDGGTLIRWRSGKPGTTGVGDLPTLPHVKPVIAFLEFVGSGHDPQLAVGLRSMLETDFMNSTGSYAPDMVVWGSERALVLQELSLQRSKAFDPRTRVKVKKWKVPDAFVRGHLSTTSSGEFSWTVEIVSASTGEVIGVDSGTGAGARLFKVPELIAVRLTLLLWKWWQRQQSMRRLVRHRRRLPHPHIDIKVTSPSKGLKPS